MSKPIDRYIEIKQQISELERELEELKDEVFKAVDKKGGEHAGDNYVLRSYKQPKYRFSQSYESKNTELKELRKTEIEDGTATVDGYSEFVRVRFKSSDTGEDE